MSELLTLYGVIMSKFGSIQKFADAIGWHRNKAMRISKGIQEPTLTDILAINDTLKLPDVDTFMQIFFPTVSAKWTKEQP
ncbi:MAG TPA: hypothetical protein PKX46_00200 [Clostridia bacterium]|nr:hypothetical protein [Clostridia bacterium]HOR12313.1 hypothetical protein [Clostridia bacterium]